MVVSLVHARRILVWTTAFGDTTDIWVISSVDVLRRLCSTKSGDKSDTYVFMVGAWASRGKWERQLNVLCGRSV